MVKRKHRIKSLDELNKFVHVKFHGSLHDIEHLEQKKLELEAKLRAFDQQDVKKLANKGHISNLLNDTDEQLEKAQQKFEIIKLENEVELRRLYARAESDLTKPIEIRAEHGINAVEDYMNKLNTALLKAEHAYAEAYQKISSEFFEPYKLFFVVEPDKPVGKIQFGRFHVVKNK